MTKGPEPKRKKTIPRVLDGIFYEIVSQSGTKIEAKCMQCSEIRKGNENSTGNFIIHYKNKHPIEYTKLDQHIKLRNQSVIVQVKQPNIIDHLLPLSMKEVFVFLYFIGIFIFTEFVLNRF